MVAWATFDRDKFDLTARSELGSYPSSRDVSRGFCRSCGTALTYFHEGRSNEIDVTVVTLDEPTLLVPEFHIWVQDKLPWMQITDRLPQFDTVRMS